MNYTNDHDYELDIQAVASLAEGQRHVLKDGNTFAIIGQQGNIRPLKVQTHGVYRDGTRFLSRLVTTIEGYHLVLLSSETGKNADYLSIDLTNPTLQLETGEQLQQDLLHVRSTSFLWNNTYYARLRLQNYAQDPVVFTLRIAFEADFADIFEVRGVQRGQRGQFNAPRLNEREVVLPYIGLDEIGREASIRFSLKPDALDATSASFRVSLDSQEHVEIDLIAACRYQAERDETPDFEQALNHARAKTASRQQQFGEIITPDEPFAGWFEASRRDILMLLTQTEHGFYPYAGVPWFSTVFGRDGIITALQTLWCYPEIARGVLAYLAAKQADRVDPSTDAEPGKILHEERQCEMANTGEVPFRAYYGSIDSTPLFLVLAGRYFERTGDVQFIRQLWPAIEAGLTWIDEYGDRDGDGFIEYERQATGGLRQQGWKDSDDSVFYADGTLARAPIALCEVQAYVYEAKRLIAGIADALGKEDDASRLRAQAETLRENFLRAFWLEELGTYAIALDGDKQPCRVRSSNAGHCLFAGIADPAHAARLTEQLLSDAFFTGWGIRTIAAGEARFNPMSYHNGSVWPHDNSLIADGMRRYGFREGAARVLTSLCETSNDLDLRRLPELFCGFDRHPSEGPTLYPVACLPQAWAAGSMFLLLQSCLGLTIDGYRQQITFAQPMLPHGLDHLTVRNLRVGDDTIDLAVDQTDAGVQVNVLRQQGAIRVVVEA